MIGLSVSLRSSSTRSLRVPSVINAVTRRCVFSAVFIAATATIDVSCSVAAAAASETVGKDPTCNDRTCLGVWDGLLADCPHDDPFTLKGAGCVSSQDDTPGIFAEPWDYSEEDYDLSEEGSKQLIMKQIVAAVRLVTAKRGDRVSIVQQEGRYLRVIFTDGRMQEESVGEFYITPNDTTVQFRVSSVNAIGSFASSKNLDRAEQIRKELLFLKLPVLRNRKLSFNFVESDLDSFGPGSAALGPPAEMKVSELDEPQQKVNQRLRIDFLQQFPSESR